MSHPLEHTFRPVKIAAHVPISAELLDDYADIGAQIQAAQQRTPAEWAAIETERKAENAERLAAAQAQHAAARAKVDGTLAKVLDMHGPQLPDCMLWPVCCGCEFDGYDAEPPEWPCTTWVAIAEEDA